MTNAVRHKTLTDLEAVLAELLAEFGRLGERVRSHQSALKAMDPRGMDESAKLVEAVRGRVAKLEGRRRALTHQVAVQYRLSGPVKLSTLAEMFPAHRASLAKLRDDLGAVASRVAADSKLSGRVAGAVLGHLNTAVRILAGAIERAGIYTSAGTPRMASRIGVMDAVG